MLHCANRYSIGFQEPSRRRAARRRKRIALMICSKDMGMTALCTLHDIKTKQPIPNENAQYDSKDASQYLSRSPHAGRLLPRHMSGRKPTFFIAAIIRKTPSYIYPPKVQNSRFLKKYIFADAYHIATANGRQSVQSIRRGISIARYIAYIQHMRTNNT